MSRRFAVVLASALLGGVAIPAQAAGCVLAQDPAGDATSKPLLDDGDLDVLGLNVDVTRTSFRFHTRLASVPGQSPTPPAGYMWWVELATSSGREIYVYAYRAFQAEGARAGDRHSDPDYDVPYQIREPTGTVSVEVPYDRARLRRGEVISGVRASTHVFYGVAIAAGDRTSLTGPYEQVDEAAATRRLVVGVGCR